jgi:hypothetical protein
MFGGDMVWNVHAQAKMTSTKTSIAIAPGSLIAFITAIIRFPSSP